VRVELPDGQALTVYTDIDRLEGHMREIAPEDARAIDAYIGAARHLLPLDLLAMPLATPWEMLGLLPKAPSIIKWARVTLEQYARRFQSPLLRRAFPTVQYDFPPLPMIVHLNFIAGCHKRILGWPMGGSLAFARSIAARLGALGGAIHYRAPVEKILVADDRAVGVRLADGAEHRADIVISAADGRATVFDMLGGEYADDRIRAYFDAVPDAAEMSLCISLGVARDMSGDPHALTLFLEQPVTLMGETSDRLNVEIFNFDPALAPAGKTPVKVVFKARYAQWKVLAQDRSRYDEEKQRAAETVIAQLDRRFPGLAQQVEVIDVATPLTIERFTGNWRGQQAWPSPKQPILTMLRGLMHTLPGLENLYLVGQWAEALPGISTVAISGRNAIRAICRRDGRRFVTSVP
jgi:phytoene dehydrogenase-like protein